MRPLLIFLPPSCNRCRTWLCDGEPDPEGAALPLDRAGADLAAHHVDHAAGDRQAEAEALVLARLVTPVEPLEDSFYLGRGYPRPGVDHFHRYVSLPISATAYRNGAGGWRVLEGVGEQADENLPEQGRVALRGQVGLDLGAHPDPDRRVDSLDRVADRGGDVDDLGLPGAERLDPGEGEE